MNIESITLWHKRARPAPTEADFNVQLGCHFEEIVEQMETLMFHIEGFDPTPGHVTIVAESAKALAEGLKDGTIKAVIVDRKKYIDSVADQVVTGVGAAHCAGMNASKAIEAVNTSNWSKFDTDGNPLRDDNGKIKKGPNYVEPNLEGCY
jgi:predicted HAD superfamily Cof-like phosphohydrolase